MVPLCYNTVKSKRKGIPMLKHHEDVWGSRGTVPYILNFGPRWEWVVRFTFRPLYPQEKSPLYPLDRRLGGPQNGAAKRKEF
jgi:hypothetical protein